MHIVIEVRMDHLLQGVQEDFQDEHDAQMAKKLQEGIAQGELTLTIPYTVSRYSQDDEQLYQGGRKGEISFTVHMQ